MFLGDFQLQRSDLTVLGLCHHHSSCLKSLARCFQSRTDIAARGDTDGEGGDAQELHHVHAAPTEHHHPALIAAHTKGKQQPERLCDTHGIEEDGGLGKGLHRLQQLHQTLVYCRETHREQLVDEK